MPENPTQEQVVEAARSLDQSEFTRDDLAGKLGVRKPKMKEGFKAARRAGQLEKVRNDEEGTGYFRVAE